MDPRPADSLPDGQPEYDCIVISDLHLGSAVCQVRLLEDFLVWACDHSRMLVINGDIFDDLNFKRLSRRHFACLRIIRRNSDRPDFRLIWIRGNHDGPADIVGHIVGVDILDEYIYESAQARLMILHGDQFDNVVTKHPLLTAFGSFLFGIIQKIAPHNAARWIRRVSKRWQRNGPKVERGAVEHAKTHSCEYVTCGHTHQAKVSLVDGVHYFNTGTWTEKSPCPFLGVRGARIELEYWPRPGAEPPPLEEDEELEPEPARTGDV